MKKIFSFKQLTRILIFCFLVNLLPDINVFSQEKYVDKKIISETLISKEDAKKWAQKKGATSQFIKLADVYWKYYDKNGGVNPAIAYVQSAKETGFGNFGGVIDESYYNPCGMKNPNAGTDSDDYEPNAHYKFKSWDEGIQGHLDHLALYAGANGYPRKDTYDPRHFAWIKGKAKTVKELGGVWAPSKTYGEEILKLYYELEVFSENLKRPEIAIESTNIVGQELIVKGWAIKPEGIKEGRVYINGNFEGRTSVNIV
ncbi:MAG: glucosaminidase domain-containing protein, partial [Sarcina sp.]